MTAIARLASSGKPSTWAFAGTGADRAVQYSDAFAEGPVASQLISDNAVWAVMLPIGHGCGSRAMMANVRAKSTMASQFRPRGRSSKRGT